MLQSLSRALPWRHLDPDLEIRNGDLANLLALWHEQRGSADIPHRRYVTPFDLKPHLGWLVLVDVEGVLERFRFRLIGSAITGLVGRDSTGQYLDVVFPKKIHREFVAAYRFSGTHRRPVRCDGRLVQAAKDYLAYESVILPYAEDDGRVGLFVEGVRLNPANAT